MKAVFLSIGTRGDIEPFMAIGELLKTNGWEVVYAFPEQFKGYAHGNSTTFYGFDKQLIEVLIEGSSSKVVTSRKGSFFNRIRAIFDLIKRTITLNKEATAFQKHVLEKETPDVVFFNQKCLFSVVWGMQNRGETIFIHPFPCFLHSVKNHSVIGFGGGGDYGMLLNRISYIVQNTALSVATYFTTRKLVTNRKSVGVFKIRKFMLHKLKSIYTVSDTLFSEPTYWPDNARVVGFAERERTKTYMPEPALENFLSEKEKIIFITFGSIINTNPEAITKIIVQVCVKHNISAIVNLSWGGLSEPIEKPDNLFFLKTIPYDWIFPRVYGVVHHGGAGTTHSALKHGCASLVVPHFIDQFYWARRVVELGAGPKCCSIKRFDYETFERGLLDLINNDSYRKKAMGIGRLIKKENWDDNILGFM